MGRIPGIAKEKCIGLFERVLGCPALREYAGFEFLRGDPTPLHPEGVKLRVDGFFPQQKLVVEFMGPQHVAPNRLMDRRKGRREQRQRYQERRTELLAGNGIRLIRVSYDESLTEGLVRRKLEEAGLL